MCFELISKVDYVEESDIVESITVFKGPIAPGTVDDARELIVTGAKLFLWGKIVRAAIAEAEKHNNTKLLSGTQTIDELWDRGVVFCSPVEQTHLVAAEVAHPDQTFVSHNHLLQNKIIVLQLNDFAFTAQYSLTYRDEATLAENVFQEAEIRIKLGLDSCNGIVYQRVPEVHG